ncbi:hypothetical protein QFZ82_005433 [Streptomyces sp. V4I23]|nr:hypothetical protein [Streptomyces sp. V4I23]
MTPCPTARGQIARFAREVVPAVRDMLGQASPSAGS